MSPDSKTERPLPSEHLNAGTITFSRNSREVLSIDRNTGGAGAPWQIWSVDVATGRERLVTDIDMPNVEGFVGFSLHPDGTRLLTSTQTWPSDIWMLEGWN